MVALPASAPAPELFVSVSQVFNRRNVGFLWDKRSELDPGQVAIINSIYNNRKKNGGTLAQQDVIYKLSRSSAGKLGYGRLYGSKGSFETLEKECRGTICKEYYHDIDIVNCHPVLLVQFAKSKYNIELPEVDKYVENREVYLKNIMTEEGIARDEAKASVIRVMYGGSVPKDSYLSPICEEVRGFSKKLFKEEEFAGLAKAVKHEDNLYGSFLSYVLQTEERKCMMAMKECLEKQGWSVDVLCYDGVMVRKREGVNCDPTALKACADYINNITGYDISLTTKEFQSFELPSVNEEVVKGVSLAEYQAMKMDFETYNFYYAPTNEYYEYQEGQTPISMGLQHATEYYKKKWNFKLSAKIGDYAQFFPIWREDVATRTIRQLSLRPSARDDIFQIPMRLKYQEYTKTLEAKGISEEVCRLTNLSPEEAAKFPNQPVALFTYLMLLITNHNHTLADFVANWFAHCLQKPYESPRVSLVVVGAKGIGKDTIFDFFMEYVIGSLFSHNFLSTDAYFEKHNCDRMHKLFVKLEEADSKICLDNKNLLKGRITSNTDSFNPKGSKTITTDNVARVAMTTNGTCPVDLADRERRFVVSKASVEKKGDSEFWKMIRKELFNEEAGRVVADWLLERDISDVDFNNLPANEYQEAVIESRMTSEQLFIDAWDGSELKSSDLHEKYLDYCRENHLPYELVLPKFGRNIMNIVKNGIINMRRCNDGIYYSK